ncbi:GTP-binding protein [Candidatus Nardonella dryophthoridicola]|uniref:GTP-binding protein n=1 Tax=Candidatus Nardonella dryophthoridicola TaxID=1971485 RepID=UPI001AD88DCA|nr:GTP-binding protein [Candidatus Nardonella dryophthoridicola]QTJ62904.1 GTP-binding protein [Candidatus Nardonella dryophthoridicola]
MNIKNFCIISHIDHGKSTLSKNIIEHILKNIKNKNKNIIDNIDIEQEKGITIKSKNIKLEYFTKNKKYILNLIDTPGHIDFLNEVYKYVNACEGCLLLIDSTKGIQAQTISLYNYIKKKKKEILIIVNKIDSKNSNVNKTLEEIKKILKININDIILCSAKKNIGINNIIKNIIKKIPNPQKENNNLLKVLIIDSWKDSFNGIVYLIKLENGFLYKNIILKNINNIKFKIKEIGIINYNNKKIKTNYINIGDIGWILIDNKIILKPGDYLLDIKIINLNKYKNNYKLIPKVYRNIYTEKNENYNKLEKIIEELYLNNQILHINKYKSNIFGIGFKCGFLGIFHSNIIKEIIIKKYKLNIIMTKTNIIYKLLNKKNEIIKTDSFVNIDKNDIKIIKEPIYICRIFSPLKYIGKINELCLYNRCKYIKYNILNSLNKIEIIIYIPMYELMNIFFNEIKSISNGYASIYYKFYKFKENKLKFLEVMINKIKINELTTIVNDKNYIKISNNIINNLLKNIKRKNFNLKIQVLINNKIIKSKIIKQFRKNVTEKCYGGDINRKNKLLKKQKIGKKKMFKISSKNININNEIKKIITTYD